MIKYLIKFLLIVSLIIISTGCESDNQINGHTIDLRDYLIITASNDLLDTQIVISTFDENGNKVDEKRLRAASAWNTEYSNNYVAIIGSKNLTLINIVTGEILRVNAQQAIDYTYIDNDLLAFVINAGLDKESGKYQSNVCLLELDGRLNYDENDYVCNQVENVLFDIVL